MGCQPNCKIYHFKKGRVIRKQRIKFFLAKILTKSIKVWPSYIALSLIRRRCKIQLTTKMLQNISKTIQRESPCNLLVFGLGNDSFLWSFVNSKGTTIFLEDNEKWFQRATKNSKVLVAHMVDYNTRLKDWEIFLENPSLLEMDFPDIVKSTKWDIILVDAPAGWGKGPGRMKSIYQASKLVNRPGHVFVHDCEREIENIYCNTFLKEENLKTEINNLRHYYFSS